MLKLSEKLVGVEVAPGKSKKTRATPNTNPELFQRCPHCNQPFKKRHTCKKQANSSNAPAPAPQPQAQPLPKATPRIAASRATPPQSANLSAVAARQKLFDDEMKKFLGK